MKTNTEKQITIRLYEDKDWQRLCEIHDAARIDELRGSVDLAAFLTLEQAYENEGLFDGEVWVAVMHKNVVGFVAVETTPDWVSWLYVDPKQYRKGIGQQLLVQAIRRCPSNEVKVSLLSGNTAALSLYQKLGFKVMQRKRGKLAGNEGFEAEGLIMKLLK